MEEVNGGKAYKLTNSAEQKAKPDSDQHHTVTNKLDVKQVSFTKSWVDFSDAFCDKACAFAGEVYASLDDARGRA